MPPKTLPADASDATLVEETPVELPLRTLRQVTNEARSNRIIAATKILDMAMSKPTAFSFLDKCADPFVERGASGGYPIRIERFTKAHDKRP
jgi:hypothetical protein